MIAKEIYIFGIDILFWYWILIGSSILLSVTGGILNKFFANNPTVIFVICPTMIFFSGMFLFFGLFSAIVAYIG